MSSPLEVKRSNYRILGLVGRGQFGKVYCAIHRRTGQFVALKALDCNGSPTHQFLRELKFLVTLQHPNIVACEAIEHLQGKRYLVIDYCEGGTLRQLMENHKQLHPALSMKLVCDVLAGLEHANAQGVVHCDIKPENILLSVDAIGWTARISDFGISRLSQEIRSESANLTGSPAYMAPERFYGQYSHSTDLYAVGILLYELLVGYRPFSGAPTELMSAHLNQPVKIPDYMPLALQPIVLKALRKLKARRYQSATQMREALQSAMQLEFGSENLLEAISAPKFKLQVLRQEDLTDRATQIAAVETLPVPEYDRYLRRASIILHSHDQTLHSRSYSMGFFDQRGGRVLQSDTISEPIQQLIVRSHQCFVLTERSLYRLSSAAPKLITRFHEPSRIAIAPNGEWMAVATLDKDNTAKFFSLWSLPYPKLVRRPETCESIFGEFIAIAALHSRHIALISQAGRSTRFDFFNRHGKVFGKFTLPIPLDRVFPTRKAHFLVATEVDNARSLILLHLKPYRLIRVGLSILPKFVAAYAWGIVVCDDWQLIVLDYTGQQIGQADIPVGICAIATCEENGLAIATWNSGQSTLYTLDLEVIRSASL
ncbi:MAG: serine/threonine protein kinase [Leptolyngbya sp. Prado105]|nr:serine/threonine protein kinase [Leptolyngbya sp. Prado105]